MMKPDSKEWQRTRDALIKHNPRMAKLVSIDMDLPPITKADWFIMCFMQDEETE